LTAVCLLPLLILGKWRIALGVFAGSLLLLGDIYALKAPLDLLVRRTAAAKRVWVFSLFLLRIVVLGALLLVLVRFRVAAVLSIFAGVSLPLAAMVWAIGGKRPATGDSRQSGG